MKALIATIAVSLALPVAAQADQKIDRITLDAHRSLTFEDLQWLDDPSLPAGAQIALIAGDPGKAGVFMVYVKLPPDYAIPAHTHPYAEVITVLSGEVGHGFGAAFNRDESEMIAAGSTLLLPAGHPHYLWNDEEVVALLVATGPWNIDYINPEDDPRDD